MKPKYPRGTHFWGEEKSNYGLLLSDSWGDMTQSVHIVCQSPEGRTEQGALDFLQSLESICKELSALDLSVLFYAS